MDRKKTDKPRTVRSHDVVLRGSRDGLLAHQSSENESGEPSPATRTGGTDESLF